MSKVRADGRAVDELRDLKIELGVQKWAEGSAIISIGNTVVICSALIGRSLIIGTPCGNFLY
jgi:ribonuclease PH